MIWFNTASFSYPFVGNDAAKFESCPSKRSCVSCAKIVRRGSCDVSVRNPVCKHDASHVPVVRHPYHFVASAFPLITARWNSERRFGFPPRQTSFGKSATTTTAAHASSSPPSWKRCATSWSISTRAGSLACTPWDLLSSHASRPCVRGSRAWAGSVLARCVDRCVRQFVH
jgi:hypothetical protein